MEPAARLRPARAAVDGEAGSSHKRSTKKSRDAPGAPRRAESRHAAGTAHRRTTIGYRTTHDEVTHESHPDIESQTLVQRVGTLPLRCASRARGRAAGGHVVQAERRGEQEAPFAGEDQ